MSNDICVGSFALFMRDVIAAQMTVGLCRFPMSFYYIEVQGDDLQEGLQVVIPTDKTDSSSDSNKQNSTFGGFGGMGGTPDGSTGNKGDRGGMNGSKGGSGGMGGPGGGQAPSK